MSYLSSLMTAVLLVAGGASREEEGQTMAEYGLILAGIAVVVMATVWLLGTAINDTFTSITSQF